MIFFAAVSQETSQPAAVMTIDQSPAVFFSLTGDIAAGSGYDLVAPHGYGA